jgi:ABC-type antimicrobial peptide transport system permease subunit
VGLRAREFGIRIALGSGVRTVVMLVVKEGLALTSAGVTLGILAALSMGWLVRGHLFDVEPTSPEVFALVALAVVAVAASACVVPARRAGSVDPMKVLTE